MVEIEDALAINGGEPARKTPFPRYNTIGKEEKEAVARVLDSGVLSQYLGKCGPEFYGGPEVQKLERAWESHFGVKHAVSMNSATSCLYAAMGALGIRPGDEVVVSPYTMVASVTAAAVYGARPVFADIDPDTFCITPETIEKNISERTRAVIVVDLFGYPVDIPAIREVTADIPIVEDAAQAPGACRNFTYCGTDADIGVFSLNYHKTIHCGEGGIAVTNNDTYAERLQLVRNHGEAVVSDMGPDNHDIIGFNFRMTEIEAAIAYEQLKKLDRLVGHRWLVAHRLIDKLSDIDILTLPGDPEDSMHGYYVFPIKVHGPYANRNWVVEALRAEGIPIMNGYTRPVYREPLYSAYKVDCPVVEDIEYHKLITTNVCQSCNTWEDIDDVVAAFHKVGDFLKLCSSR